MSFSWKHPWSSAHDTYLAERLRDRYLYVYPGRDYLEPNLRDELYAFNRRMMQTIVGSRRKRLGPETDAEFAEQASAGKPKYEAGKGGSE